MAEDDANKEAVTCAEYDMRVIAQLYFAFVNLSSTGPEYASVLIAHTCILESMRHVLGRGIPVPFDVKEHMATLCENICKLELDATGVSLNFKSNRTFD